LRAQAAAAPAAVGQTAMDPAYVAGYNAGFPLGRQDKASGLAANAHKFSAYQEAAGDTRAAFQSGFDDGYGDGFAGRPSSVAGPNPAPVADTTARGYRKGYNNGQTDANRNAEDNPAVSDADAAGADATVFAKAYATGYDDGYHHRLYNTAMGGKQYLIPTEAASPGGNDLPTDPERLRARASGVYDNGLLIAEGTRLQTTLNRALSTKTTQVGEPFTLTVTVPVWVGAVAAIPAGSTIQGTVENVTRGGKVSGAAQFQLQYNTLTLPGQVPVDLHATTAGVGAAAQNVDSGEGTVSGQAPDTGRRAATGAAVGGAMGGIFGGMGGLIRGGIAGAAIGGAGAIISHKKDIELRTGEPISVRLDRPLELPKAGQ